MQPIIHGTTQVRLGKIYKITVDSVRNSVSGALSYQPVLAFCHITWNLISWNWLSRYIGSMMGMRQIQQISKPDDR